MGDFFGSQDINEAAARIKTLLSMAHVRATRATAQSIPHNAFTTVIYNIEEYDDAGEYNPATGIFIAARSGRLRVSAALLFTQTTTWARTEAALLAIYVNGAVISYLEHHNDNSAANIFTFLGGSGTIEVTEGDAVTIRVFQNSGAALNLWPDANYNQLTLDWLA